jgi:hypothetical protein
MARDGNRCGKLPHHFRAQSRQKRSRAISKPKIMKKEYDFSKAERGRFYRPNAKLNLPVYLEPKVQAWLDKVAGKRGEDVGKLVNRLLKKEIELAEAAR